MKINFKPVWFDSMGAKSSCSIVETPDINILIDPGISILHNSFPASDDTKKRWEKQGRNAILNQFEKADLIIITHYHYDHYFRDNFEDIMGKKIFIKNPNEFINDSQRLRSEEFFKKLFLKLNITDFKTKSSSKEYLNPLSELKIAMNKDFKTYTKRRQELLEKGKIWFNKRVEKWNSYQSIPEIEVEKTKIYFPEEKEFSFGKTKIKFSKPLFHGIEFSRVGWVFSVTVEYDYEKLFYSSDLNGPIIEDYAQMIINENPDILILDGPMTYMFGYLLNKINLNRAIENAVNILKNVNAELIIYDHHLTREKRYKDRTKKVWETATKLNKNLITASEFYGNKPVCEELK